MAFPLMRSQALQDTHGQCRGVAAVLAADARPRSKLDAAEKVLQLPGQLIAAATVEIQDFHAAVEKLVLEPCPRRRVQPAHVQSEATQLLSRLYETHLPPGKVEADVALGPP